MHEVHSSLLWIGNALDVREPRGLFQAEITAVIDVAYEEPPAQIPRQWTYCRFPLNDGGGNEPQMLWQTLRTTCDFLHSKTRTIIACSAGMSRSPTVAAFALAHYLQENPHDVIAKIASMRSLELKPELWRDMLAAFARLNSPRAPELKPGPANAPKSTAPPAEPRSADG